MYGKSTMNKLKTNYKKCLQIKKSQKMPGGKITLLIEKKVSITFNFSEEKHKAERKDASKKIVERNI
jgi:hypothetical protein